MKSFADLKDLSRQLKDEARAREVEQAERARAERQARAEANVFRDALAGVQKMPKSDRYVPGKPAPQLEVKPAPRPRSPEEEAAAVLAASLSDQFDVEGMLDEDPSLSYARDGVGPDVLKKLRKRHWPVQGELDLHGMNRDEARAAVTDFLHQCERRGRRCVRIIHGKGYGSAGGEPVLRSIVHSWLVQKSEVVAFCVAGKADGGHGALIVLLRAAL